MKIARVNQAEAFKYDTKKVGDERRRRPEGGRTTSPTGFNLWSLRIERRRWIFIYATLMAIARATSPPKLGFREDFRSRQRAFDSDYQSGGEAKKLISLASCSLTREMLIIENLSTSCGHD